VGSDQTNNGVLHNWIALLLSAAALSALGALWVLPPAAANPYTMGAIGGFAAKCLDVDHSNSRNGTAVQLWGCNNSAAQAWTLAPDGTLRAFGKCLDISTAGKVQLWDCNGTTAQQWLYTQANDLLNTRDTRCLTVQGPSSADGTHLSLETCRDALAQKWAAPSRIATSHRVVIHYRTQFDGTRFVSPLSLVDQNAKVSDLIVGTFTLEDSGAVLLNGEPLYADKFAPLWADLGRLQAAGVRVLGLIGGSTTGSYQRLDTQYDRYYPLLRTALTRYRLDGVDLDVNESMSLAGIERVIAALHADFGDTFAITLAPAGGALSGGDDPAGFDYEQLYRDQGSRITWFNLQLYDGSGSLERPDDYDAVATRGLVPPQKLVAETLTNPANGSAGYVEPSTLNAVIRELTARYLDFGGVGGQEYWNALPGGNAAPWLWPQDVAGAQGR
jgi:hypothetical protein